MEAMGKFLIEDGHRVTMVVPSTFRPTPNATGINIKMLKVPHGYKTLLEDGVLTHNSSRQFLGSYVAEQVSTWQLLFCEELLNDTALMKELKETKFELLILDWLEGCSGILRDFLDAPSIYFSNWGFAENWNIFSPVNLAYLPGWTTDFPEEMSLLQRMSNIVTYILNNLWFLFNDQAHERLRNKYNLNTSLSLRDSFSRASLMLCNSHFYFDFPRPSHPHIIPIGGLFFKEPRNLSVDLNKFVESSERFGVIIVSFGSYFSKFETSKSETFAKVFASLPQKVLWRFSGERPLSLGNNTLLLDWLPQNDLLANAKARLFITHCGIGGSYEALQHGVPVLAAPLFGDQFANARKLVSRVKMGEMIDYHEFTESELREKISQLLSNPDYKRNALKASKIMKNPPVSSRDIFRYWVSHVIDEKGPMHLTPQAMYKLSWYQYFHVDVTIAFIVIIIFLILMIKLIWKLIKGAISFLTRKGEKRKVQ